MKKTHLTRPQRQRNGKREEISVKEPPLSRKPLKKELKVGKTDKIAGDDRGEIVRFDSKKPHGCYVFSSLYEWKNTV